MGGAIRKKRKRKMGGAMRKRRKRKMSDGLG